MMDMDNSTQPPALSCPVCDGVTWRPAGAVRRDALSCCADCGLLATTRFLSNREDLGQLYDTTDADYRIYNAQYRDGRLASYRRWLNVLDTWRTGGRLLEIGSGYGDFLALAAEAGWEATGVEISAHACTVARSKGCEVHQGRLEEAPLPAGSFDAVVLWDVIEHLPDPNAMIQQALDLLTPGGVLLMKTPDGRALAPSVNPLRTLYRHFVYPANTPEHVFHFTPDQLTTLAQRNGAGPVACDTGDTWAERIISGNNPAVRAARWAIMGLAHWRRWPYEFVLVAQK